MGTRQLHTRDRLVLQACIEKELSLQDSCKRLGFSRSTIFRELHRHTRTTRNRKIGCGSCVKFIQCKNQNKLDNYCKKTEPIKCPRLKTFPYVCNVCKKKLKCNLEHYYYDFEKASEMSHTKRRQHHKRISISLSDLSMINRLVTNGLRKGQSLHHIYVSNPSIQIVSERTIRRYLYDRRFEIGPSELPRYVRFNHNPKYKNNNYRLLSLKNILGRTYQDFQKFMENNKVKNVVELDTVVGKSIDERAILTIYLTKTKFMFGILVEKSVPKSVNKALLNLKRTINPKIWNEWFNVILTDNGLEFSKLEEIEIDENGEKITNVFYCDPYSSFQKGECERNHEFIRYIISKGKTFDYLNQEDVNLLFSHINSYKRKSLNEKTPYELTKEFLGAKFLKSTGIIKIPSNQVTLKSNLLK